MIRLGHGKTAASVAPRFTMTKRSGVNESGMAKNDYVTS